MSQYEQPDFWSKKAFSEGYPARSVYKLQEINEKFNLFEKSSSVLDLGAAPGSWTMFVLRYLDSNGKVCSIDLKPLDSSIYDERLTFIQGDLYDKKIIHQVQELGPYDTLICDAAPATTGNKTVDTSRSESLVELAIFYATQQLKQGGNFVVKLFQGGNQPEIIKHVRELFQTTKAFKPKACRSSSFETYLIGIGLK